MLKQRSVVAFFFALAVAPALALAAPRGEAKATVAGKTVAIDYGRPTLSGRDMLGQAQVGKPWRMGADGPTTLTTEVELAFVSGKTKVPKGTYVLTATKASADKWVMNIAQSDGTAVADVPLESDRLPESIESFTIELHGQKNKGDIQLKWGVLSLKAAFTGK